jgi:alpha-N-arabinofuranosidase
MQASVHLDTQHNVGPVDPRTFGGFLEHMGRAVYTGIYDPGSPLSGVQGFRRDVLEALRPLGMPIVRYPGGNFVSAYNWVDGIGPLEERPRRPDVAWRSIETNQFGAGEFMDWCHTLGTAPMLAVNLGTGSVADAAQLLEYCNLPAGTAWADARRRNGHPEPYGVRTWCLGNEMDGAWQSGHVPADVYAQRAWQAAQIMKGIDPTIETVLCGSSARDVPTYMEWDRIALDYCWDFADYISAHRYSNNGRGDSDWYLAEGVAVDRVLDDYAGLIAYVRALKRAEKRVYVSFDEWGVVKPGYLESGAWNEAPPLVEVAYNLEDALVYAQYLAAFVRRADLVKVACVAQLVNVIAPILTRRDGLLRQSTYYPFLLFSRHARGVSLAPIITAPRYEAGEHGEVPVLDAAATYNQEQDSISVFLINRLQHEALDVTIHLADRRLPRVLGVDLLGGMDVHATNTWEHPDLVHPVPGKATLTGDGDLEVRVPAPGLAVVRVSIT